MLLVDTPTDLRQQALTFGVNRVDAVLYTHGHADHTFGIDELRVYNFHQGAAIPCYGSAETLDGELAVLGFRFGSFAYVTDCKEIPEESFARLDGVEILILGALRYTPHPTHFSFAEALAAAERIGARRTYFTHMNHDVDYGAPAVELPPGVELAYDGLSFEFD